MFLLRLSCVLCPPIAVWYMKGRQIHLPVSILCTLLGWIPGVIYALYLSTETKQKAGGSSYGSSRNAPKAQKDPWEPHHSQQRSTHDDGGFWGSLGGGHSGGGHGGGWWSGDSSGGGYSSGGGGGGGGGGY